MPGHTVFENDDAYTTLPRSSSDSIVGWSSPSKRSSTYGSSSKIVNSYSAASSSRRRRLSSESVQPAGFWKLGMMWASRGRAPASSACSSAPTSIPSGLERDREDLGAEVLQREQRAVVGRGLDHHEVAGPHQLLEEEGVRLHRPVGGDHLLRLHAVLLGDPGDQPRVAGGGAVGEGPRGIALEGALGGRAKLVDGDDVERRSSPRERDVRGGGHAGHDNDAGGRASGRLRTMLARVQDDVVAVARVRRERAAAGDQHQHRPLRRPRTPSRRGSGSSRSGAGARRRSGG